jgi:hypothetical protein
MTLALTSPYRSSIGGASGGGSSGAGGGTAMRGNSAGIALDGMFGGRSPFYTGGDEGGGSDYSQLQGRAPRGPLPTMRAPVDEAPPPIPSGGMPEFNWQPQQAAPAAPPPSQPSMQALTPQTPGPMTEPIPAPPGALNPSLGRRILPQSMQQLAQMAGRNY